MDDKEIKLHLHSLHNEIVSKASFPELQKMLEKETYFAGGCFKSLVLNEKVNDYDIYFKTEAAAKRFKKIFQVDFEPKLVTNNAVTIELNGKTIQFITKFFGQPFQVIRHFDFEHCQNFYNPADKFLELKSHSILSRTLVFNNRAHLPISSIKRIAKFAAQGWIIKDKEVIKLAKAISFLKLADDKVLEEQIAGLNFSGTGENPEKIETESDLENSLDDARVVHRVASKLKGL